MKQFFLITLSLVIFFNIKAQNKFDITKTDQLELNGLTVSKTIYKEKNCIMAFLDMENNKEKFIGIPGLEFKNGTIELEISGEPGKYANAYAKGFVGIAFRTQNDSTYECMYIRPVNAVADNQKFRNWSVQYTSRPVHTWKKLRTESPGQYETYAPTKPGEWTKLKIVVEGSKAILYVNNACEPTLIVTDLKLGDNTSGGIGLWVGSWTLAHFRNLKIEHK